AANLVLNGGTLLYSGPTQSTGRQFTLNANSALNASGTGSLTYNSTSAIPGVGNAGMTLGGTNTSTNTLAMAFGGTGGLTKADAGQWVVSGANTYSGPTTISGGTLTVDTIANGGSASRIGQSSNAAANLVFSNGTLRYTGTTNIAGSSAVFDYNDGSADPAGTIKSILTTGYGVSFATGQLHSSTATASIGLGWLDDTTAKQVTVRRVLYGDANLSGTVDT